MDNKLKEDIEEQNRKNKWEYQYKGTKIVIRQGDLTEEYSSAIVNPANEYLVHEGGAARSIADKAGKKFDSECREYISANSRLPTGKAMITSAGGELCCDKVIHTVGPKYNKGAPDNSLANAQLRS